MNRNPSVVSNMKHADRQPHLLIKHSVQSLCKRQAGKDRSLTNFY